jgi:four helix bundle protein
MATIRRVEDIQTWQKARELVREIYKTCAEGALTKDFGLRDQLRRAAVSAMANVAEGFARKSDRDFAHFLDIAKGSADEVQSLLYVALDVGYVDEGEFQKLHGLADETVSLTGGLTSYLRRNLARTA